MPSSYHASASSGSTSRCSRRFLMAPSVSPLAAMRRLVLIPPLSSSMTRSISFLALLKNTFRELSVSHG